MKSAQQLVIYCISNKNHSLIMNDNLFFVGYIINTFHKLLNILYSVKKEVDTIFLTL